MDLGAIEPLFHQHCVTLGKSSDPAEAQSLTPSGGDDAGSPQSCQSELTLTAL